MVDVISFSRFYLCLELFRLRHQPELLDAFKCKLGRVDIMEPVVSRSQEGMVLSLIHI